MFIGKTIIHYFVLLKPFNPATLTSLIVNTIKTNFHQSINSYMLIRNRMQSRKRKRENFHLLLFFPSNIKQAKGQYIHSTLKKVFLSFTFDVLQLSLYIRTLKIDLRMLFFPSLRKSFPYNYFRKLWHFAVVINNLTTTFYAIPNLIFSFVNINHSYNYPLFSMDIFNT